MFRHLGQLEDLARLEAPAPAAWPRVSVVIPARNEALGIARALESRLADGYPDLEIVVVDDRSDDNTPRIIADFAARDPRPKAVRVDELPHGWLGEVNALAVGAREATGDWMLFSDADVEVAPRMLSRAVAHCETRVVAAVADVLAAHGVRSAGDLSTDAVATSDASALATGFHTAEPGENACVVAHDGPIRTILNHYLGVPPEKWWTLSTTHGGVSLLEFSHGWVNVRNVNASSHLAGLGDSVYVPSEPGDQPAAG